MQRFAGATMIAGSLLFVIGGLTLPIPHYFGTSDPMLGLQYIEESPAAWDLGNAMFGAGGLIAAIGLVLLARSVHRVTSGRILAVAAYVAATLATAGAMLWVIISYIRIVRSPFDVVFLAISPWLFRTCGLFTETAFIIFGFVVLLSGYPKFLGWMLIVAGTIMFVARLAFDLDLVPFVYYLVFLILGVTLLILRPRWPRQSLEAVAENESLA